MQAKGDFMSLLDKVVSGIFDHAGEFPPASLPFLEALSDAGKFKNTLKRPELVASELVTSIKHAAELARIDLTQFNFTSGETFRVCFLGSLSDFDQLKAFHNLKGTDGVLRKVVSYEVKLEATLQAAPKLLDQTITNYIEKTDIMLALEPDFSLSQWHDDLLAIVAVLKRFKNSQVALKIRANGPTAVTSGKLAHILELVADENISLKVTGAHHHPILEPKRYQNEFGFLNLILALLFRRALGKERVGIDYIMQLLSCDNFSEIKFEEQAISYRGNIVTAKQLLEAKKCAHFSIGSCSLSEPDEDLVRLEGRAPARPA